MPTLVMERWSGADCLRWFPCVDNDVVCMEASRAGAGLKTDERAGLTSNKYMKRCKPVGYMK